MCKMGILCIFWICSKVFTSTNGFGQCIDFDFPSSPFVQVIDDIATPKTWPQYQ